SGHYLMDGLLVTPMAASAAVGTINVADGLWDTNWGTSLGSSATVNGYYMNVDAYPTVTTYYFGIDTVAFNFNNPSDVFTVDISIDCNQNGSYNDAVDLQAQLLFMFGSLETNLITNPGVPASNTMTYEIIGDNRIEIAAPVTTPNVINISECVANDNTVLIYDQANGFEAGPSGSTPTAIQLQSFNASDNTVSDIFPWIIGVAVISIAGVAFLRIRRRKVE
ncbi:MAG: hypothetical protein P8183_23655, partial [Anaerolineae bacterium]